MYVIIMFSIFSFPKTIKLIFDEIQYLSQCVIVFHISIYYHSALGILFLHFFYVGICATCEKTQIYTQQCVF